MTEAEWALIAPARPAAQHRPAGGGGGSVLPPVARRPARAGCGQADQGPLHHLLADRVYRGRKLLGALADLGPFAIEIVQRPAGLKGFQLLPRRWVVERSFAWFGRNRRLAKDFEASIESAQAWLTLASVKLLIRRIARSQTPL